MLHRCLLADLEHVPEGLKYQDSSALRKVGKRADSKRGEASLTFVTMRAISRARCKCTLSVSVHAY